MYNSTYIYIYLYIHIYIYIHICHESYLFFGYVHQLSETFSAPGPPGDGFFHARRSSWDSKRRAKEHVLFTEEMLIPSGYVKIAIDNGLLYWIYPLKMVIFHSYP